MCAWPRPSQPRVIAAGGVLVGLSVLLIAPVWGLVAVVPAVLTAAGRTRSDRTRRWLARSFELTGLAAAIAVALSVLWIERRDRPFPNAGWTEAFGRLNGVALFAVIAIAVGAMFGTDAESRRA